MNDDEFNAARGIVYAVGMSMVFWCMALFVWWIT